MAQEKPESTRKALLKIAIVATISTIVIFAAMFAFNGLILADGETPSVQETSYEAEQDTNPRVVTVLAYNIAKCFAYTEGEGFSSQDAVVERLDRMANLINEEQPDIVFLSEVVTECSPIGVNQARYLAVKTGMHAWAFGENYNFGLPTYRIVGGNAILSRWPLTAVDNVSLAGRRPFFVTKNNRRVLWCRVELGGEEILLGAIHTDSFDIENNQKQTEQILAYCKDQPTILAGDFNANPDETPIKTIRDSGQFGGEFAPERTFPANSPDQTLDYIFAPASWRLIAHRVLDGDASDHRAVVSVFELPERDS